MLREPAAKAFDIAGTESDRSAARRSARRVGEANETLPALRLEELDDRREAAVAGSLRRNLTKAKSRRPSPFGETVFTSRASPVNG